MGCLRVVPLWKPYAGFLTGARNPLWRPAGRLLGRLVCHQGLLFGVVGLNHRGGERQESDMSEQPSALEAPAAVAVGASVRHLLGHLRSRGCELLVPLRRRITPGRPVGLASVQYTRS